uniref:Uncharacterized protein n=1 Tax=Zea mays TaxID=4577 RepID=B6UED2_MAIZE|nr:hypothetical protein [Zea mays]
MIASEFLLLLNSQSSSPRSEPSFSINTGFQYPALEQLLHSYQRSRALLLRKRS